ASALALAIVYALALVATPSAQAQTFQVIHTFTGADGYYPQGSLTMDAAGNLYGTTVNGGDGDHGIVFKLSYYGSGWVLRTLYSFTWGSSGGANPQVVAIAPDGSLYGTTQYGGIGVCFEGWGCGTVFQLTVPPESPKNVLAPWDEVVIHSFTGKSDG